MTQLETVEKTTMSQQTEQEAKLAAILVDALELEDLEPGEIGPDWPLFGFDADNSLGLDSIDALEIALAIDQNFGVKLKAEDENTKAVFASLRTLSDYISAQS
ncbi:MAG: xanthomonadin biosynthesis acyl carrier protein XanC [Halioglobus sp.]